MPKQQKQVVGKKPPPEPEDVELQPSEPELSEDDEEEYDDEDVDDLSNIDELNNTCTKRTETVLQIASTSAATTPAPIASSVNARVARTEKITKQTLTAIKSRITQVRRKIEMYARRAKLGNLAKNTNFDELFEEFYSLEERWLDSEIEVESILDDHGPVYDQMEAILSYKQKWSNETMVDSNQQKPITTKKSIKFRLPDPRSQIPFDHTTATTSDHASPSRVIERNHFNVTDSATSGDESEEELDLEALNSLKPPSFSGEVENFNEWWGDFSILVHRNRKLHPKLKFIALRRCLKGDAESYTKELHPSAANYEFAITALKRRYRNINTQKEFVRKNLRALTDIDDEYDLDGLRKLRDKVAAIYNRANEMKFSSEYINGEMLHAIKKRLPFPWQQRLNRDDATAHTTSGLINGINFEITELEQLFADNDTVERKQKQKSGTTQKDNAKHPRSYAPFKDEYGCPICDSLDHSFSSCVKPYEDMLEIARKNNRCFKCFKFGHNREKCRTLCKCDNCGKGHLTFLCERIGFYKKARNPPENKVTARPTQKHREKSVQSTTTSTACNESVSNDEDADESEPEMTPSLAATNCSTDGIFYQTCLAKIGDKPIRVLFDSGSGLSYIDSKIVDELNLKKSLVSPIAISKFNSNNLSYNDQATSVPISSINGNFKSDFVLRVIDNINGFKFPSISQATRDAFAEQNVNQFDTDLPISILFGLNYHHLLSKNTLEVSKNSFYARETKLGWCIYGGESKSNSVAANFLKTFDFDSVHSDLENDEMDPSFDNYLRDFTKNSITFNGVRYSVKFPFLTPTNLSNNFNLASNRLNQTIRSLTRSGKFSIYENELLNLERNGFAEKVEFNSISNKDNQYYYLPHHPIIRENRETTKLRIVFDASAATTNRYSLNDVIHKGVTNWDSWILLQKFRNDQFGVCADIEKAFLMIEVDEKDRNFLRFLWKIDGTIVIYRMRRVPFGTTSSPFLLFAVVQHHLNSTTVFQKSAKFLSHHFYVDDFVASLNSATDLSSIHDEAISLMNNAGMNLTKWRTNNHILDQEWSPNGKDTIEPLGVKWNIRADTLHVPNIDTKLSEIRTKRNLSSILSSIYDPLGIILPYCVKFKLILRQLWLENNDWDTPITADLRQEAMNLLAEINNISDFVLARKISGTKANRTLHVFTDASPKAIGAVIYITSPNDENISFVQALSQMVKRGSIPDLELKAIQLAAKNIKKLSPIFAPNKTMVWCDSTINVERLNQHPNKVKPNVAARIWNIRNTICAEFHHVSRDINIADILTRGCSLKELKNNEQWLSGPKFLKNFEKENSSNVCLSIPTAVFNNFISQSSTLDDLLLGKPKLITLFDAAHEITKFDDPALNLKFLVSYVQSNSFGKERILLRTNRPLPVNSELRKYPVYLDDDDLIRLRTRFSKSIDLTDEQISPIFLPKQSGLSWAITEDAHIRVGHMQAASTFAAVRSEFFIPCGRKLAHSITRACEICRRLHHTEISTPHAPLPLFRCSVPAYPYSNVGIDFFGPITLHPNNLPKKYYGLIYTCANTRGIQLELTDSIDAPSVLRALRNIFARVGVPDLIYSDNGKSFVKTDKILDDLFATAKSLKSEEYFRTKPIKWVFQTPLSPWKGGIFERMIRTTKHCLSSLSFGKNCSFIELQTLLHEISAIINSRPLFANDTEIISPAHFTIGRRTIQLPYLNRNEERTVDSTLLNFNRRQKKLNGFWRQWLKLYLMQLPSAMTNRSNTPHKIRVGDVVLLNEPNKARSAWPIAIVKKIYNSGDDVVRQAEVTIKVDGIEKDVLRSTKRMVLIEGANERQSDDGNLEQTSGD